MARFAAHPTLTAATVASVTITSGGAHHVTVTNHDSAAAVYFTVDGSTPTVAGDDTYFVGPASSASVPADYGQALTVKLISSATPTVSVVATSGD